MLRLIENKPRRRVTAAANRAVTWLIRELDGV
jgi:hypothetical protein